jgi:hypothetical protein
MRFLPVSLTVLLVELKDLDETLALLPRWKLIRSRASRTWCRRRKR